MSSITVQEEKSHKGKIALIILVLVVAILAAVALVGMTDSTGIAMDTESKEVMIADGTNQIETRAVVSNSTIRKNTPTASHIIHGLAIR